MSILDFFRRAIDSLAPIKTPPRHDKEDPVINDSSKTFNGLPLVEYEKGAAIAPGKALRIAVDWEAFDNGESAIERLQEVVKSPGAANLTSLVIGDWGGGGQGDGSKPVVDELVAAASRLPKLEALFIGDMESEECEISWIVQCDLAPLLAAYPRLRLLQVRGGSELAFSKLDSEHLQSLVIETGGLPRSVVQSVLKANLPNLTKLELWLGSESYGGDTTIDDLQPLLKGQCLPRLTHLGLRDCEMADELAKALQGAAVLPRLQTLDLSLGNLSDDGAAALLANPALATLKRLDLSHHFMSDEMMAKMARQYPQAILEDQQEVDTWGGEVHRFIAVSE